MGRGFKIEWTSQEDAKQLEINPQLNVIFSKSTATQKRAHTLGHWAELLPIPMYHLCYIDATVYPKL